MSHNFPAFFLRQVKLVILFGSGLWIGGFILSLAYLSIPTPESLKNTFFAVESFCVFKLITSGIIGFLQTQMNKMPWPLLYSHGISKRRFWSILFCIDLVSFLLIVFIPYILWF